MKIYKYLTMGASFALALLYALFERSKRETAELERAQAEAESEALERISEGVIAGQKAYDEVTATKLDRSHFANRRVLSLEGRKNSDS